MGRLTDALWAEADKTPFEESVAALPKGAKAPGINRFKSIPRPFSNPETEEFQRRMVRLTDAKD